MDIDEGASISEVERQRQAFDERILARLAEHGALEGVPRARPSS